MTDLERLRDDLADLASLVGEFTGSEWVEREINAILAGTYVRGLELADDD